MTVSEMLTRARLVMRVDSDDWLDTDLERFAIYCGHELVQTCNCTRTTATLNATANTPELDLSGVTDFRQERLLEARVTYNDRGTWATATAYAVNDLVQGDGTPDALYYTCVTAHTSDADTEPPDSNWTRVRFTPGTHLQHTAAHNIRAAYNQTLTLASPDADAGWTWTNATEDLGRPHHLGMVTDTLAWLYPTPDIAYPITLVYDATFAEWTIGQSPSFVLNVPDEFAVKIATEGIPAVAMAGHPEALAGNPLWAMFKESCRRLADRAAHRPTIAYKQPPNWAGRI